MMRIDKYLAEMGQGTRSEIKKLIRSGRVMVDGETVKKPELKIDETTQKDDRDKTVLDLITDKKRNDLFPVGRLDKDTEGLLLITNDGELAHRLLSPKKHVDKVYYAKVQGKVDESDVKAFADGVDIGDDTPAKSADLRILKSGEESEIELTITEGRFHQVKRMFHAVGKEVIYLKRLSMGSLALDKTLTKGEYRSLTEEEIKKLC